MGETTPCDVCGRPLSPGGHYVVRIDVYADPSLPPTTGAELAATDFGAEVDALVEQMKNLSAEELEDQVHRRFEYAICPPCQREFLSNPLGKPRRSRNGRN